MIAGSQKKPSLRLPEPSDKVETAVEQIWAAASACLEHCSHPAAYTIPKFCQAHGEMSIAHFHNLRKRGDGPVVMKVGRRTLISAESAAEWRRRMEALAGATNRGGRQP